MGFKHYTPEFQDKVAIYALAHGAPSAQSEFGVDKHTALRWSREILKQGLFQARARLLGDLDAPVEAALILTEKLARQPAAETVIDSLKSEIRFLREEREKLIQALQRTKEHST